MPDDKILLELVKGHIEDDRRVHENYIGLLEKISDQTKETQDCVSKLDKKLDLSIQKIQFEIKEINRLDQEQNKSLAEHIKGVKTNRELLVLHKEEWNKRLEDLERFRVWRSMTWTGLAWFFGAVTLFATMVAAIGKALPYLVNIIF